MGSTETVTNLSWQLFFGVMGMVVLTVFLIVFFVVYQRRLLTEQEKASQMELDYQRSLLNAGILAQEAERKRFAVDLHDGVGGVLSAIKLYVRRLQQDLPPDEFSLLKDRALGAIAENIVEIRNVTNNLLPQSLERVGLVAASKDLCSRVADIRSVVVDFKCNEERRFSSDREKAVFRIIQELINNTLKHSEADRLELQFDFDKETLKVRFSENGQGFDRKDNESQLKNNGLGLKGIESRVAFLGAQLEYETAPGEGVSTTLLLRLEEQAVANENLTPHE